MTAATRMPACGRYVRWPIELAYEIGEHEISDESNVSHDDADEP